MQVQGIKSSKIIGENIRKARMAKKLTQEELAAQMQTRDVDISRSTLAKIEAGIRHISVEELLLIKELLGMDYADFFKELPSA